MNGFDLFYGIMSILFLCCAWLNGKGTDKSKFAYLLSFTTFVGIILGYITPDAIIFLAVCLWDILVITIGARMVLGKYVYILGLYVIAMLLHTVQYIYHSHDIGTFSPVYDVSSILILLTTLIMLVVWSDGIGTVFNKVRNIHGHSNAHIGSHSPKNSSR